MLHDEEGANGQHSETFNRFLIVYGRGNHSLLLKLLALIFKRKRFNNPENLIDEVIVDLEHRITESRLQLFAVELAAKRLSKETGASTDEIDTAATKKSIEKLEATLQELKIKRNLLVARTRDAETRAAIEQALMNLDRTPAEVALELLESKASDMEAQADAAAEVRQISEQINGGGDV